MIFGIVIIRVEGWIDQGKDLLCFIEGKKTTTSITRHTKFVGPV